jgi:hypothetical protein
MSDFILFLGIKMYIIAEPGAGNLEPALRQIYELYADYVLKVSRRLKKRK